MKLIQMDFDILAQIFTDVSNLSCDVWLDSVSGVKYLHFPSTWIFVKDPGLVGKIQAIGHMIINSWYLC